MNELAEKLNKQLEGTIALDVLSDFGKNAYMPNGITVQSANCKKLATKYNATIGVALDSSKTPMNLKSVRSFFSNDLTASEIFAYSLGLGNAELRKAWKEDMIYKNPSLKAPTSLPAVASGLTNSLFIAAKLFISPGDSVVIPNLYWENYDLVFSNQCGGIIHNFNLFKDGKFDVADFKKTLLEAPGSKVVFVLNFPNNPTGYTPTKDEAAQIVNAVKEVSEKKKVVAICDDAYFLLFFEENCIKESLFTSLADLSENIMAVKCDAATKEEEVWGFRVGFITFASKGLTESHYKALESKVAGVIRGTISCASTPGQTILLHALTDRKEQMKAERKEAIGIMKERYEILKSEIMKRESLFGIMRPLPFNSGYFMSFELRENKSDEYQKELLEKDGIGVISLFGKYIRIAFSSVDKACIPDLVKTIYDRAEAFFGK